MTDNDKLELHKKLCHGMSMLLSGHPPEVQSTVLAEMLATWLGGWPEDTRPVLIANHIEQVEKLIPLVEVNFIAAEDVARKH